MTRAIRELGIVLVALCAACSSAAKPGPGATGTAGAAGGGGATGVAGASGSSGPSGAAGAAGASGATGTAGATGVAGASGATGTAGTNGATGTAGASGSMGTAGADAGVTSDAAGADAGNLNVGVKGHPDPTTAYPKRTGFTLYLVEELNAPLDLDKDPLWTWGDGTIDDGLARFGEDAITFADGKMKITISKGDTPAGRSIVKLGAPPGAMVQAKTLKSGEFRSKYNMFRYGRYEVSMKAPAAESNFVLSMFSFRTPHYQEWREIDFELVADLPTSLSTNVIVGMNMTGFNAN